MFADGRYRLEDERNGTLHTPDEPSRGGDFARCCLFRDDDLDIDFDATPHGESQALDVPGGGHASICGRAQFEVYANDVEAGKQGMQGVGSCGVGFEEYAEFAAVKGWEDSGQEVGLEQGFAACDGDGVMACAAMERADGVDGGARRDGVGQASEASRAGDSLNCAGGGRNARFGLVAVGAGEVAPCEAEKYLAAAYMGAFTLDGAVDFNERA